MSEEKPTGTTETSHSEAITPAPERTFGYESALRDEETAKYAAAQAVRIDEETSSKLFWTINKRILVVMLGVSQTFYLCFQRLIFASQTYFCQSLDKGTLGFSSIMGIRTDAHLVGQDYSWLGTILYMGVLVGEYPTNYLLQKLPVAKYLAAK